MRQLEAGPQELGLISWELDELEIESWISWEMCWKNVYHFSKGVVEKIHILLHKLEVK